jgi:uncharacterized protein
MALSFVVDTLPVAGLEIAETLESVWVDEALGPALFVSDSPVTVTFQLVRSEFNVRLDGAVEIQTRFRCSRCAEAGKEKLTVPLNWTFVHGVEDERDEGTMEVQGVEEARNISFFSGPIVDLEPVILEHIVFAAPSFPICRTDCKGLCAQCGQDLNVEPCTCEEAIDPRWEKLRDIRLRN